MEIYVDNRQSDLSISVETIHGLVEAVLQLEKQQCDEVGVHLVSIDEITELHERFFDDPTPTDCISCPIDMEAVAGRYRMLGDLFVCPQVAIQYAMAHEADPHQEATLYIVHGLLHLLGFDDIEESDRAAMRAAEERNMQHLKRLNLWLRGDSENL